MFTASGYPRPSYLLGCRCVFTPARHSILFQQSTQLRHVICKVIGVDCFCLRAEVRCMRSQFTTPMADSAAALKTAPKTAPKNDDGNDARAIAVQAKPAQPIAAYEAGEAAGASAKYREKWAAVLSLPCDLTVELPVPGFKVGDLFRLQAKTILESQWHAGEDVPLRVGGQLIGWGEFEVVGNHLAVRITELR